MKTLSPPPSNIREFIWVWQNWLFDVFTFVQAESGNAWEDLTLINSWVDFGSTLATAGYIKHVGGTVEVKGSVKSGTTTAGTVISTLPVGFRPIEDRVFVTVASGSVIAEVRVKSNGDITYQAGNNTELSLDTIKFWAEQ